MQTFLLTLCALTLAASLAAVIVSQVDLHKVHREALQIRKDAAEIIRAATTPTPAQPEKHTSDYVRVCNVIQSVTRYTGRTWDDVASEFRIRYPATKVGRHYCYTRQQAEVIRNIYKPKKA